MEERVSNDATLMQRIRQLEQERDELRLDVEQLCKQHSGIPTKVDTSTQIHARRIFGLEQEMEMWKQKLQACTLKNHKLQDELSEAKKIKALFADLLKSETDKNLELGKEIKYFQGQAATALVERDRALFQVEECLEDEKKLTDEARQLQKRLELLTSELLDQKEDSKKVHNVVNFFWKIRSKLSDCEHAQNIGDKATLLLQDSESSWTFGNTKQELESLQCQVKESWAIMAALQQEICVAKESATILQRQLEEEIVSKQHAKERSMLLEKMLFHLTEMLEGKLRRFRSVIILFKEEIMRALKEEADSLMAAWESLPIHSYPISQASEQLTRTTRNSNRGKLSDITEVLDDRDALHKVGVNKENSTCSKASPRQGYESEMRNTKEALAMALQEMRDTKEALAMALQEKVDALLLLSQQEERHISEENMVSVRENKIAELQKQLLQVTIDKGDALIQVANLTEELASSGINNNRNYDQRSTSFQRPLKSWFKGYNIRSNVQTFLRTTVRADPSLPRLKAENSFLWSVLSKLYKLCSSVNRLHEALVKVRDQLSNGCMNAGSNNSDQLDFVICEARHLGSLATSYEEQSITVEDISGISFHALDCQGTGADLLSIIGKASLEAILFAAEVYKNSLNKQMHC